MPDYLLGSPLLLCLLIFLARICDVSIGTIRTILVIRGKSVLAACLGFVEVLIWIMASAQVLTNLDQWYLAVSYAAGFGVGNYVGIWLESRMALGLELVRAVSENRTISLAKQLRENAYSVVTIDGMGEKDSPVEVAFIVEKRRKVHKLLDFIATIDPDAYCTISDVKKHGLFSRMNQHHHARIVHAVTKKK